MNINKLFIILLLVLAGCNASQKAFEGLDVNEGNSATSTDGKVEIVSWTPTATTINFPAADVTFAVTLNPEAGQNVNYKFLLDNVEVSSGSSSYYSVSSASLATGAHTLKVIASNSVYSDDHSFNIYKNDPPVLTLNSSSSASISCNGGSFSMQVTASDTDRDAVSFSYFINGASAITGSVGSNIGLIATHTYTPPNSSVAGVQPVTIRATDARGGVTDYTINVTVITDGPVFISSWTPTANPIDLTDAAKTFAVSLAPGSGPNVNYRYLLDTIQVQTGSSSFFVLNSSAITAGAHTLRVVASNSVSSDDYSFNLYKNTNPVLTLNANSALSISCAGGSFSMQVTASDIDNDAIVFSYLVNGVTSVTGSSGSNAGLVSTHVFSPPTCATVGAQQITIRATDARGGVTDYTMAITVNNPNVAAISSFFPTANPVVIKSTETTNFVISATGNPPLNYAWSIAPGGIIQACNNFADCNIRGTDFPYGQYVLTGGVTDASATTANKDFNVILNAMPTFSITTPSVNIATKMNCSSTKNFAVTITDANYTNPGQVFTVSWAIDGIANPTLDVSTNTSTYPFTSVATFSPACSPLLLGDHTISVTVSDGHESRSTSWNIQTNYLSTQCNTLLSDSTSASRGRICTLAGLPGMGNGINPSTNPSLARVRPQRAVLYRSNEPNAYFMADSDRHVVWFYNGTANPISVIGKTVAAGSLVALIGNGAFGQGTIGQTYNNFFLWTPRGLYYDEPNDLLYIADYNNSRILAVGNNGAPVIFAGSGSSETDGAASNSHRCWNPHELVRDGNTLYVTCYGSRNNGQGIIKGFSLVSPYNGTTLLKFINDQNVVEGTIGMAGTGGAVAPWAMVKHPTANVLFASDNGWLCRVYAINYGTSSVTLDGLGITIDPNNIKRLSLQAGCGGNNGYPRVWSDANIRTNPSGLEVREKNGVFEGLYISDYNHAVLFLNTSGSTVNIGGRSTLPGNINFIVGNFNAAYSRAAPLAVNTVLWGPTGLFKSSAGINILDPGNGRVSSFDDLSEASTSALTDRLGSNWQAGFDGVSNITTTLHHLSSPTALVYEPRQNQLLFYDSGNSRARSINLSTGKMDIAIGNGNNGQLTANPVLPLDNSYRVRNIRQLSLVPGEEAIVYADGNSNANVAGPLVAPNTNNTENCAIRAWNFGLSTLTLMNLSINANNVRNIAGDRGYGCANWRTEYEGRSSVDVTVQLPLGIVVTPNLDMYIANNGNSCIMKVSGSTGIITTVMGLCGTAADNLMGTFATSRFNGPGFLEPDADSVLGGAGNFFIVDRYQNTSSQIKYVNFHSS